MIVFGGSDLWFDQQLLFQLSQDCLVVEYYNLFCENWVVCDVVLCFWWLDLVIEYQW